MKRKPKIGLALGSGGAKGLSHIGVIKVLEDNGISIDFIAGSSIGALIGGAYAVSGDIKEIENTVIEASWKKIFSLIDPNLKGGLIGGEKVKKFIEEQTKAAKFNELKIPLSVVATNLKNGMPVVLRTGDIASAIRASISFPLLFRPFKFKNQTLSDGGLSLPVPVKVVKEMGADIVIAVNLDGDYFDEEHAKEKVGFYQTANNSINILKHHLAIFNIEEADITISPKIGNVSWGKFLDGRSVIYSGEKAMRAKMEELKTLIGS